MRTIEGFRLRKIGKEYIITGEGLGQVNFNQMIGLNESSAYLWQEVDGKDFDAGTLATLLVKHYEIDEQTAMTDAEEILNNWIKAQIVA